MDAPAPRRERHPLEALQRGDALIDHPVAARVSWTPLLGFANSGRGNVLVERRDGTWRIRPPAVLYAVFITMLLVAGAILLAVLLGNPRDWAYALATLVFPIATFGMLHIEARWSIDPARGWLRRSARLFSPDAQVRAADVVALQLLSKTVEVVRGGRASAGELLSKTAEGFRGGRAPAGELNLVLADGSRLCLLSHGAVEIIRRDAMRLASALRVPVWEGGVGPPRTLREWLWARFNAPL